MTYNPEKMSIDFEKVGGRATPPAIEICASLAIGVAV
jgi:hypothetical protein